MHNGGIIINRPYRAPHHSASMVSLVGGGMKTMPGEVSLAHHGILFLDELPEFSRQSIEALRLPLENGEVVISRANNHYTYPSKFQFNCSNEPLPMWLFRKSRKTMW